MGKPEGHKARPAVLGVERSMLGQAWRPRLDESGLQRALALSQAHGLDDLLARVLASRGVDSLTCRTYLQPALRDLLPDPDRLTDMAQAVARLEAAILRRERVAILGDYDVDGAAAAALLAEFLRAAGLDPMIHIPDRLREGYGPSLEAVQAIAEAGTTLLVTVDCGSGSHAALDEAARRGLETVVIDHHGIGLPFPAAVAIVNPNRPDDLSGLGSLCAAGVVFMVLVGLNRRLKATGFWVGRTAPDLLAGLDLVALGTVADVVPLVGLNRAFVHKGLQVMRARARPGLAALFDVAGADGPPTVFQLGYLVGPRINAGGRIGDAALGARLLLCGEAAEARQIALDLDGLNRDRRQIEAAALEEAEAEAMKALDVDTASPVLVAAQEGWHPGVVGLVAARLRERYGRPAFAIALAEGIGTGSGRSIAGADLGHAVRACVGNGLLRKGGGHAMAAGITIEAGKIAAFTAFLADHFSADVARLRDAEALGVDATLTAAAVTPEAVAALEAAGPFGAESPEPVVAFPAHRVLDMSQVGDGHLRLTLAGRDGTRLRAMAFRAARSALAEGLAATRGQLVHCAGTLTLNRWGGGAARAELRLLDAAPTPIAQP